MEWRLRSLADELDFDALTMAINVLMRERDRRLREGWEIPPHVREMLD